MGDLSVGLEVLQRVVTPFLAQHPKVFVALGCRRVYVATVPSTKCKRCGNNHENHEVTSLADLKKIATGP